MIILLQGFTQMTLTLQLIKHLTDLNGNSFEDKIITAICLFIGGKQYLTYYHSYQRIIADIYTLLELSNSTLPFERLHNNGELKPDSFIIAVIGHYTSPTLMIYVVKTFDGLYYMITFCDLVMTWIIVDITKPDFLKQDFMSEELYNELKGSIIK